MSDYQMYIENVQNKLNTQENKMNNNENENELTYSQKRVLASQKVAERNKAAIRILLAHIKGETVNPIDLKNAVERMTAHVTPAVAGQSKVQGKNEKFFELFFSDKNVGDKVINNWYVETRSAFGIGWGGSDINDFIKAQARKGRTFKYDTNEDSITWVA